MLELQALKRNGSVSKSWFYGFPSLTFNYNTDEVTLYTVPGGRYSPPRTYLKIIFQPAIPQKIFIYKEGIASKIGKTLGMQDIQMGIDSFDREVIIKGTDEFFIKSLLTYDIQDKILLLADKLKAHISLSENKSEITFPNIIKDEILCDKLINLGLRIVDKIK